MSENTPKVLIVDDDEITRDMVAAALRPDYRTQGAASGSEALMLATESPPDAVVLDVSMPDMDGYAVCQALKAEYALEPIPVIFLSGRVTLDDRMLGYAAGGEDYLTKPYNADELRIKLGRAIERRKERERLAEDARGAMAAAMAAMSSFGEMGAVLEFLRRSYGCNDYAAVADALIAALASYDLDACVRVRGQQASFSRNMAGPCSALEDSILDHLQQGERISSLGSQAAFNYENVLVLVRNMPRQDPDRYGRFRDNLAIVAEGAAVRLRTIDIEYGARADRSRRMLDQVSAALDGIATQQSANQRQIADIFRRLLEDVEKSFIFYGLTDQQEEQMAGMLRRYLDEAMTVFDASSKVDQYIHQLAANLQTER